MKTKRGAQGVVLIQLSSDEREKYGCIVDFSDGTVFRDLQRTRSQDVSRRRLVAGVVVFPEQHMLGLLGRQDLLEVDWALGRARVTRTLKRRGGEA